MTPEPTSIRAFLDLSGGSEVQLFFRSTKKETSQMQYDKVVKHALKMLEPMLRKHLDSEVIPTIKKCETIMAMHKLSFPALPLEIREAIIDFVDRQKLNHVQKTYILLDMLRSTAANIARVTAGITQHHAEYLEKAPKILNAHGRTF